MSLISETAWQDLSGTNDKKSIAPWRVNESHTGSYALR